LINCHVCNNELTEENHILVSVQNSERNWSVCDSECLKGLESMLARRYGGCHTHHLEDGSVEVVFG
jgi:hypothetical protein